MQYRTLIATCAVAALLAGVSASAQPADTPLAKFEQAGKDWPLHGGSDGSTRYSPLDQINSGNIKSLGAAWNFDLKDEQTKGPPVVADGMMFVSAAGGHVTALDAATGAVKWSYLPSGPGIDARKSWARGRRRQGLFRPDRRQRVGGG